MLKHFDVIRKIVYVCEKRSANLDSV